MKWWKLGISFNPFTNATKTLCNFLSLSFFHQRECSAIVQWEIFPNENSVCGSSKSSEEFARDRVRDQGLCESRRWSKWDELCSVCRAMEKWEKIWFRGWSWTTYNNELNIYHSVYLHHKKINVSSTFERKICAVEWGEEEWGVVDWVLLVFHVLVSCLPFTSFHSHINGEKGFNSLIFIKSKRKTLVTAQDMDYYKSSGVKLE